jgi:hypothetical protein
MSDLESGERLSLRDSASSGRCKGGSAESIVLWAALLAIGVSIGIYALMRAVQDEPVATSIVAEEESAPSRTPSESPTPRRTTTANRPARVSQAADKTGTSTPGPAPAVVYHTEAEKRAVDPEKGFETGEAFDNPPSPGRYGQRSSGLFGRPGAASEPMRPNQPDPSFGPEPADRAKAKAKGRSRP